MRNPDRIQPFVEEILPKLYKLFEFWKREYNEEEIKTIVLSKDKILEVWIDYPDLRFSQVLIILNLIDNAPGFWYYAEESDILNWIKNN